MPGSSSTTPTTPLETLLGTYSAYAGRALEVDEAVYRSEAETGHRNRAIAHLLRSFDVLLSDAEAALDLYFRQCSVAVDCRDLAFIAATLAGGGVNPLTGERARSGEDVVRSVLSVMTTCGMYDGAGEWLVSVGIPAKSGVVRRRVRRASRAGSASPSSRRGSTSRATACGASASAATSRTTSRSTSSARASAARRRCAPRTRSERGARSAAGRESELETIQRRGGSHGGVRAAG